MRKFPYFIDVQYASGRTEILTIRTSQDEAKSKTQLQHMVNNGIVTGWKPRSQKAKA